MMASEMPGKDKLEQSLEKLIDAFHVLHRFGVLDEYGHISVRNPLDASTFINSHGAPLLLSSAKDLMMWNVSDGSPVTSEIAGIPVTKQVSPLSEHYIHASIFAMYPRVQSVVHSHAPEMISWGIQEDAPTLMQASYHMAGFLGRDVPVFDVVDAYKSCPPSSHNLLITSKALGDALARTLQGEEGQEKGEGGSSSGLPSKQVVLQTGHGFVTWAEGGIEAAVYKAVHAVRNARIQRDAELIAAATGGREATDGLQFLQDREIHDCIESLGFGRPSLWLAWLAEVQRCGLYDNEMTSSRQGKADK